MLVIGKAVILLILELIIEYLFGTLVVKLLLKRKQHPIMHLLVGFISYQVLFQITALVFIVTTGVLHHLTIAWCVLLAITVLISVLWTKTEIKEQTTHMMMQVHAHKMWVGMVGLVVLIFCYYVSINGEANEDARYYIGLMTTSVDTDSLFKHNVYNGYRVESLYLRRALTTFEIQGAVFSQMSGVHPLIIARVFRASQNVVLSTGIVYLCSALLFWQNEKERVQKSLAAVVVFWILQLMSADTIYAPAQFLLYRSYEAKAFTANIIVLLGLYLWVKMLVEKNYRILFLLGIFLWGSLAISTSALFVAAAECFVAIAAVLFWRLIHKKKQESRHAG